MIDVIQIFDDFDVFSNLSEDITIIFPLVTVLFITLQFTISVVVLVACLLQTILFFLLVLLALVPNLSLLGKSIIIP